MVISGKNMWERQESWLFVGVVWYLISYLFSHFFAKSFGKVITLLSEAKRNPQKHILPTFGPDHLKIAI